MGTPADDGVTTGGLVVLGVPYENSDEDRAVGAAEGPASIRRHSHTVRRYRVDQDADPLTELAVRDAGDVSVVPGSFPATCDAIEAAVTGLLDRDAVPVTMGGDGSVTLAQLRAAQLAYPDLCVIHVDAHTDAYPEHTDERHASSTAFSRALAEGVIRAEDTVHVGLRGTTRRPALLQFARESGFGTITMDELMGPDGDASLESVRRAFLGRPVYLCWDMDVLDPSAAPGVLAPVWGGLGAREAINLIRSLAGLGFVYFDVNGTCPRQDVNGLTASLAGHMMFECFGLASRKERTP
jgi:arginase family enzyme